MARLSRATFALLLALLPASAATIGFLVLRQEPHVTEIGAIGLIIVGVAVHQEPEKFR
jgi:inner membrane transporter RhtA